MADSKDQGSRTDAVVRPLRDGIDGVRSHVGEAAHAARDAASATADRAIGLADEASGGIERAPLVALAGGIVIGAAIGAILPRTDRETAALGAIGARLLDAARDAAEAARDAGRERLDEAGISRDGARDAARGVLDAALAAAFSAGNAAADAARQRVRETRD